MCFSIVLGLDKNLSESQVSKHLKYLRGKMLFVICIYVCDICERHAVIFIFWVWLLLQQNVASGTSVTL